MLADRDRRSPQGRGGMMDDLILLLRKQADEIASEGHNGWGNLDLMAADEIDRLRAELAECIVALEKIANPISAMKRALPVGATLNGAMATTLSNDPNYLKEIAKAALAARKGEEEGDGHAAR